MSASKRQRVMKASVVAVSLAAVPAASWVSAADAGAPAEDGRLNRFGAGFRMGFNVKAKFEGLGRFPRLSNPGPATGGGLDREYDDGYNRVDSSGNAGGLTWNWGYDNASQVPGDDTLRLHSAEGRPVEREITDDPTPGFEIYYMRDVGEAGRGRWGGEFAFGFQDFLFGDHHPVAGRISQIEDAYALNGVIPPLAPYAGSFAGPGPLISDTPSRRIQSITDGVYARGERRLMAKFYSFRLGPYWEVPLSERVDVSVSGGFAFAVVDGCFDFRESVTAPGMAPRRTSGSAADTDVVLGGYVAARAQYRMTDNIRAYAEAQFMDLTDYAIESSGKKARLDLDATVLLSIGLNYSF